MNVRVLAPEEWQRIPAEAMPGVREFTKPESVSIVAVEDEGGEIVACLSAMTVTMLEGTWVAPRWRGNAGVLRSLIAQACAVPLGRGEKWAFAATGEAEGKVDGYIKRLGGLPVEGALYVLPLGD